MVEPRLRAGLWEGAYWSQNSGLRIHEVEKHIGCPSIHSQTHTMLGCSLSPSALNRGNKNQNLKDYLKSLQECAKKEMDYNREE